MRKGEKGIALSLSLADCDRRHGRPKVQCNPVDIGGWDHFDGTEVSYDVILIK